MSIEYGDRFRKNLRRLIREAGVTQRELAIASGVTQASISQYLSGERLPSAPLLYRLARGLDSTMDELWWL
jgi:transcriptional regulator with XRE-family HTH domain